MPGGLTEMGQYVLSRERYADSVKAYLREGGEERFAAAVDAYVRFFGLKPRGQDVDKAKFDEALRFLWRAGMTEWARFLCDYGIDGCLTDASPYRGRYLLRIRKRSDILGKDEMSKMWPDAWVYKDRDFIYLSGPTRDSVSRIEFDD